MSKHPVMAKLITSEIRLAKKTLLEFKVLSPTGIINSNMGGIGLGLVAALDNNIVVKKASFSGKRMWTDQIHVTRSRNVGDTDKGKIDKASDKSNKAVTKAYQGGKKIDTKRKGCIFKISPPRFGDDGMKVPQPAGFLDSCHFCNKRLHGKDIYMYRGEKAFCSPECRSRQIAMDERPEKYCSSQVSSNGASRVIATGIFAI